MRISDWSSDVCSSDLQEHLLAQAGAALSGQQFVIATQLIGQMDEAGYLEANLLETAYRLNVALNEVEAVLGVIHTFDPTGVGARSLAECIALPATDADRSDPAMARLLDKLELLGGGALPPLTRLS